MTTGKIGKIGKIEVTFKTESYIVWEIPARKYQRMIKSDKFDFKMDSRLDDLGRKKKKIDNCSGANGFFGTSYRRGGRRQTYKTDHIGRYG